MIKSKLVVLILTIAVLIASVDPIKAYASEYLWRETGAALYAQNVPDQEAGRAYLSCRFILEEGSYVGLLDTNLSGHGTAGNDMNYRNVNYINYLYDMAGADAVFYTRFDGYDVSAKLWCYMYNNSLDNCGWTYLSR